MLMLTYSQLTNINSTICLLVILDNYAKFIKSIYRKQQRKNRRKMLSFELSAIDLILVISVIVLLILYMTKLSAKTPEEKLFEQPTEKNVNKKHSGVICSFINPFSNVINSFRKRSTNRPVSMPRKDNTECPRGFGNIKKLSEDNSISEKCLGCYNILNCYDENKFEN
jgi:hypothetical protein